MKHGINFSDLDQDDKLWLKARVGRITSSNFKSCMMPPKVTDKEIKLGDEVPEGARISPQGKAILQALTASGPALRSHLMTKIGCKEGAFKTLSEKKYITCKDMIEYPLSEGARGYLCRIMSELVRGEPLEFDAYALRHGKKYEPIARTEFEFLTGLKVQPAGLALLSDRLSPEELKMPKYKWAHLIGASTDGFIGEHENLEIKCPVSDMRHMRFILFEEIPKEYIHQVQGQLWVTGRKRCHFTSFFADYGRIDTRFKQHSVVIERDEKVISEIEESVLRFADILAQKRHEMKLPECLNISEPLKISA